MNQDFSDSLDPELIDQVEFADDEVVLIKELVALYQAVGWLLYAADPDGLARAVDRSTYVVTARDDEGALIGLARCLSDDVSIMYLQDLLVHPDWQGRGIGSFLARVCVKKFEHVRQRVLLTDDEPSLQAFYQRLGYTSIDEFGPPRVQAFVAFGHDAESDS